MDKKLYLNCLKALISYTFVFFISCSISAQVTFNLVGSNAGNGHTSTVIDGADTYEITISASSSVLYALIGGNNYAFPQNASSGQDELFFNITKNGNPTTFDLVSMALDDIVQTNNDNVVFRNNSGQTMASITGGTQPSFSSFTNNTGISSFSIAQDGDQVAFSLIEIANAVALPVELIKFGSSTLVQGIQLDWQTAIEINNERFEIEDSQDGRVFQKIGEVKGNGTTAEQQEYSFEVKNPKKGVSYYRLKQIDFDGQFEYSKVISVDFKGDNGDVGELYPNPSKSGVINLDYFAQSDDEITISVFDVTGKLVVNQIQSISRGNNNLSFDFSELNIGIYIVKIGDERNPTHRKLIIER
jgi:hypothetical protein